MLGRLHAFVVALIVLHVLAAAWVLAYTCPGSQPPCTGTCPKGTPTCYLDEAFQICNCR